jgi:hypothetical protein
MQFTDWTSMHLGAIEINRFVIPNWYLIAIALAAIAYYIAFIGITKYKTDIVTIISLP